MSNEQVHNHGIGFFGMLTILFIGLKLTGVVVWSWVMVLFPLWLPVAIWLLVFTICTIFSLI